MGFMAAPRDSGAVGLVGTLYQTAGPEATKVRSSTGNPQHRTIHIKAIDNRHAIADAFTNTRARFVNMRSEANELVI